jgi:hypothetical protein
MSLIVKTLTSLLGPSQFGALEYYFRPASRQAFGPLNGSPFRQSVYSKIVKSGQLEAIAETGTFRGTTTEYFADSGLPIYSVEAMPRYFGFAQARLAKYKNVSLTLGDSRSFLKKLADDPNVPKTSVFFYLDAHWSHDLPLRDEVDVIFRTWKEPIVMVDDFQVKTDVGYGFDDYGSGNALTLDYLEPVKSLDFVSFFPAAKACDEAIPRRGWVVLSKPSTAEMLRGMSELVEYA